jgi:hypothetical protein
MDFGELRLHSFFVRKIRVGFRAGFGGNSGASSSLEPRNNAQSFPTFPKHIMDHGYQHGHIFGADSFAV